GFERGIERLAEIVPQQHVFGRDRGIGLELEQPVAVAVLTGEQRIGGARDGGLKIAFAGLQIGLHVVHHSLMRIGARSARRRGCRSGSRFRWWRAGRYRSSRRPAPDYASALRHRAAWHPVPAWPQRWP